MDYLIINKHHYIYICIVINIDCESTVCPKLYVFFFSFIHVCFLSLFFCLFLFFFCRIFVHNYFFLDAFTMYKAYRSFMCKQRIDRSITDKTFILASVRLKKRLLASCGGNCDHEATIASITLLCLDVESSIIGSRYKLLIS